MLEPTLRMDTLPCIPSTMLVDGSVLDDLLPLTHRHGTDDTGMKIALARWTRFDDVAEPLVERGRPDDQLSRSWAHVEGRRLLGRMYADLYERFPADVRRGAMAQTCYRAGRERLEERPWSPAAVLAFVRAAYHEPADDDGALRACLASVFGRAGLRALDALED